MTTFDSQFLEDDVLQIDTGFESVTDAAFLRGQDAVLAVSSDGVVRIFDTESGERLFEIRDNTVARAIAAPDGRSLLALTDDGAARTWSADDGSLIAEFHGHRAGITGAAFFGDCDRVISVDASGAAYAWDARTGEHLYSLQAHQGYPINCVNVSNNGEMLVTTSGPQRAAVVWDSNEGKPISFKSWVGESQPAYALFGPDDSTLILLVSREPTQVLRFGEETENFRLHNILSAHDLGWSSERGPVPYLTTARELDDEWGRHGAASDDGRYFAILYNGPLESPRVWDAHSFDSLSSLQHEEQITSIVQLSPDGAFALTATGFHPGVIADGSTRDAQIACIWETASGRRLFELLGHTDTVSAASFDRDTHRLLTAGLDGQLLIWNLDIPTLALFSAADHRDTTEVSCWLERGVTPTAELGAQTAAHLAAFQGDIAVMETVLAAAGGDVDLPTCEGRTPLMSAASGGHKDVVARLLEGGADPNRRADWGGSALSEAASCGHTQIVQQLIEAGADPDVETERGFTPLLGSLFEGHEETALALMDAGADTQKKLPEGDTPLLAAAFNGIGTVVDRLLGMGASPQQQKDGGYHALYAAAVNGHLDIVRSLLRVGAPIELATDGGFTPLHAAAADGHLGTVQLLLEHGASQDVLTKYGDNPLSLAANNGHPETVQVLLDAGADPGFSRNDGVTPLYTAAANNHPDVVRALLSAGSDPNQSTKIGELPLHHAAFLGSLIIMEDLLRAGADASLARNDGATPLMMAASGEQIEAVRVLLAAGADPATRDDNGFAACAYTDNPAIIETLSAS
jgi:ankyrin repeat protein/WD40 repeat protein